MNFVETFIDKYNLVTGAVVTLLTYLLGKHWMLFAAYLIFNVVDWLTGWMKSRLLGKESSLVGLKGIIKKFGYWIMIALSFGISVIFIEIGDVIGVDLQVTSLLGWLVLASLIINEIRSIVENLVESGYHVPVILTKGLSVAHTIINDKTSGTTDSNENDDHDTPKNV